MSASPSVLHPTESDLVVDTGFSLPNSVWYKESSIIFDWDDTILPSSWLGSQGMRVDSTETLPERISQELFTLEENAIKLLNLAWRYGKVVIITNAETGWVELSARRFLPRLLPLLSEIEVISARSTYEHMFPGSPLDWKLQAFTQHAQTQSESLIKKNIISVGDSMNERQAVYSSTEGMTNVRTKSVKFVERPNAYQINQQIELLVKCFDYICTHDADLDIVLTLELLN